MLYVIDIEVELTRLIRRKRGGDLLVSRNMINGEGRTSGHAARNRWVSVKVD